MRVGPVATLQIDLETRRAKVADLPEGHDGVIFTVEVLERQVDAALDEVYKRGVLDQAIKSTRAEVPGAIAIPSSAHLKINAALDEVYKKGVADGEARGIHAVKPYAIGKDPRTPVDIPLMRRRTEQLLALLRDPQPGLATWVIALANIQREIAEW